jgi:SAM-dependent methyltransferase
MDWNERYAIADYVFGREPSRFVVAMEPWLDRGSRVLCVADGEGRNSVYLAKRGHTVAANDFAPNAIAKARTLAQATGVHVDFEQADLTRWTWPRHAFDAVFAVFIQFVGPDLRSAMFSGLKQAVRPGGLVLLHGYTPRQLDYKTGGPPFAENMYTPELLARDFADCDISRLEAYEAELSEGAGHAGRSALIDLVARTRAAH